MKKVMELMHTHVVTVRPESNARDALDKMDLYQISGLPVVDDDNKVVGVISEHDVIRKMVPSYAEEEVGYKHSMSSLKDRAQSVASQKVTDLMSAPAITIDENSDAMEAAALMLQYHVKRIPVTSEEKLVGVISRIDVCQAVLEGSL